MTAWSEDAQGRVAWWLATCAPHGCSPVNLLHIFKTPFIKNASGRLLLKLPQNPRTNFIFNRKFCHASHPPEPVVQRCSVKNVFLGISQNSQENTCVRISFLIKLQVSGLQLYLKKLWGCIPVNFGKSLRTPFFIHRTPLVAVQKLIYMARQTFSFFLLKH